MVTNGCQSKNCLSISNGQKYSIQPFHYFTKLIYQLARGSLQNDPYFSFKHPNTRVSFVLTPKTRVHSFTSFVMFPRNVRTLSNNRTP